MAAAAAAATLRAVGINSSYASYLFVCVCAMRCFFGAFFDMKISFYNVTCVYERAGNVKRQFIAI